MTEYDFSPGAHHRYLESMHGISKWVDQTEQYRSQFENAAALAPQGRKEHKGRLAKRRSSRRPRPSSLPLPPQPGMMYAPYPTSPYSGSSSNGFGYSSAPNSPGPMPSSPLYHHPPQYMIPAPNYGYGVPPLYLPYGFTQGYPTSPSHSHAHGASYAFQPSPPFGQFPGMSGGSMMVPGYIVLPHPSVRKGSHRRKSMSYVYV